MRKVEIQRAINLRRQKLNQDAQKPEPGVNRDEDPKEVHQKSSDSHEPKKTYPESDGTDLVGVALSGGGIRSAMFNLGLMQSMQRAGFLKHVDYISSVSGGGYTNGYYSTLGHHDATSSRNEDHGLSAKDAQFLLDGQYLNRPTEFMTDYLLKTALLFGTVFASVIFLASILAIYFRYFDYPSVRRWLGLLDLNSDLRVGIFASVVLIVAVLVVRGVYRSLQRYVGATPSPAPGRWAVIAAGILLLGCAVMIGNGDFFISEKLGFLPEKIDLKSLQIPIAIIVAMLFFPLMRIGSLVRSERITASLWQRVALWVILSGATWGSFFVAVGYLGQENLSGFINHRPPKLEAYDIFHYERLGKLISHKELEDAILNKWVLKPGEIPLSSPPDQRLKQKEELQKLANLISNESSKRNAFEKELRQDNYEWDTWLNYKSATLQRWTATVLGMTGCDNDARDFVIADTNLNEKSGKELLERLNDTIRPSNVVINSETDSLKKIASDSLVAPKEEEEEEEEEDLRFTKLLLMRAARKVVLRTEGIPGEVRNSLLNSEKTSASEDKTEKSDISTEVAVRDALEVLNRWVSQGSPMARRMRSDPTDFRDASDLRTILEVLAPAWTNHPTFSSRLQAKDSTADQSGRPNTSADPAPKEESTAAQSGSRPQETNDDQSTSIGSAITQLTPLQHWSLNRLLLEVAYPEVFKERRWISTSVTISEDQSFRWTIMIVSGIVALIGVLMVDINHLSPWFLFYRKRVHETFLRKAGQIDSETPLHALNPCEKGHPYPLFVGGLFLPHAPAYRRIQAAVMDGGATAPSTNINPSKVDGSFGSLWYSFLMSPLHVGWMQATTDRNLLEQKTYRCTKEYLHGGLTVSDAIVLSGAAVSTFMASNPALRVLMQVFNIRLEQWLPNPITKSQPTKHQSLLFGGNKYVRFNTFQLFQEWLKSSQWSTQEFRSDSWGYGVVADGGFREFLGVEELIARRCKIIVASDAGCNNGLYEFGVLADLIRKLRLDHDVEILDLDHDKPLDTKRLVRIGSENSLSPQHYIVGRIKYPKTLKSKETDSPIDAPEEGLFVYVQMSLTGDEDIDIAQFKKTNPQFPDEPISNQFYSKDQVESFRQLGEHIGKLLCWDIDDFDCPIHQEDDPRNWRIETLDHAFRQAYHSECRQESTIATDDARIGWLFDGKRPTDEVAKVIKAFESPEETDHQILIRNFVWHCVDGYHDELRIPNEPYFDFKQLNAADLYGIAIESNRRHSGFRPEWPTAFFQINGKDLLMRATQRAHELLEQNDALQRVINEGFNLNDHDTQKLIKEFSRLAVMLPRAVFRLEGVRTATDVLICLIHLGLQDPQIADASATESNLAKQLLLQLRSEPIQRKLRRAVHTGNSLEVEAVLREILLGFYSSAKLQDGENPGKGDGNPEPPNFEATSSKKPR